MSELSFVTFSKKSVHRELSAKDGSAIVIIVTSVQVGFPAWALALARDFCDNETIIIPDSPEGWRIHARYFNGAHRMCIFLDDLVIAEARITESAHS